MRDDRTNSTTQQYNLSQVKSSAKEPMLEQEQRVLKAPQQKNYLQNAREFTQISTIVQEQRLEQKKEKITHIPGGKRSAPADHS